MELLICQTCGHIIRGRSKSCNGCGVSVSKHSPTLVTQGLNSSAALTVGAHNDPLVLERTVNQLIYKNGNGNGNGNGHYGDAHGTGTSYGPDGPRLYDEADLNKIIYPVSEASSVQYDSQASSYSSDSNGDYSDDPSEYESQRSDDYLEEGPLEERDSYPESEPPRNYQSEQSDDNYSSPSGGAVPGTPMAAGAAHAMAALSAATATGAMASGAFGQSDSETYSEAPQAGENYAPADPGDYQERQDDPVNEDSDPPTNYQPPQAEDPGDSSPVHESAPSGADFFSGAGQSAGFAPPTSASGDFSAAPSAPSHEQFQPASVAAPAMPASADVVGAGVSQWASMPMGDAAPMPAEIPAAPAAAFDQSATVVAQLPQAPVRPNPPAGAMDFFAATNSSAPAAQAFTPVPQADSPSNSPAEIASFMQGAQASIIQNAIQAAMNSQVQPERTFSNDTAGSAAPSAPSSVPSESASASEKKPKAKKKIRPKPESDDEDDSSTVSLSKPKKKAELSTTGKSSNKTAKSPSPLDKKSSDEPKKLEIMGFPVPAKMLGIAAVLIVFVGFPIMVLLANVSSILSGLGGAMGGGGGSAATSSGGGGSASTGGMTLTGQWDFAYQNPNQSIGRGLLSLTQNGTTIEGYGVDKAQFQVRGTIKDSTLTFNKQYVQAGQPMGKPIVYQGKIDYANANPPQGQPYVHVSGVWQLTKREGFSWRAQIVQLSGRWEAALTKPGSANGDSNGQVASNNQQGGSGFSVSTPTGNAMGETKDPKKAHDFFMKVAMGIIGIGVALAMVSLKFFGPSGLLNIWAKKEYIPSQFKAPHFKMVQEMGKPPKPGSVPLGTRLEWGIHQFWRPRTLTLPPELREQNPHVLIIGAGSKGKSRLMASMIANDIEGADRAVVLVDSDGALADLVMNWIAAHPKGKQIAKRVIVIDPTHDSETMCYNPLEFPEDGDLQNAASALVFGFKAIYTEPPGSQSQWNQQTANILRNSGVLLMANGKTLTDLPVLLSDNDFRDIMLEKVERMKSEKSEYTTLIEAWMNYKRLARTDQWINWIEPILNRVQPMLGDPRIRPILTKAKGDLNLKDIITDRKVLLVKIPQGQLDQNANLLGSLIVTGVKQAALSLSVRGKTKQRPCALYLDEFDTFIEKETFDAITSETRKFQIGFCGAAKTLQILPEDYRNQIIINCGLMACFALAKKDGDMLGPQMFRVDGRKVKHQTIQNVFNKVNTSPQFELISDEEKLNIDRVVGQEERTYFCYRVGTVAGVFHMKSPDFKDIPDKDINWDIIDAMYANRQSDIQSDDDDDEDDDADEE